MDPGYSQSGIRRVEPDNDPPPAFDTEITVPADVKIRIVFGGFLCAATALNAANVKGEYEVTSGGGYFETGRIGRLPGSGSAIEVPYGFAVKGGMKYKFTRGGLAGVTESIPVYNFVDVY